MDGRAVDITEQILGAAIAVHRALGPGLLESTYEACLAFELIDRGLPIVRQAALPVVYLGVRIDCGYRLDLVVEGTVIVEIKSVERILPVHEAQILTSLRVLRELCGDHPWPERRLCTSPTGVPMLAHARRSTGRQRAFLEKWTRNAPGHGRAHRARRGRRRATTEDTENTEWGGAGCDVNARIDALDAGHPPARNSG